MIDCEQYKRKLYVNECIEKMIRSLRGRHINRRKMHILNNDKQLHSKYVLVPADKASNNVQSITEEVLVTYVEYLIEC